VDNEVKDTQLENEALAEETIEKTPETKAIEDRENKLAKKEKVKQEIIEWVKSIVSAVIIAAIILQFIMPTVVHQHSMENTLQNGDYLIASKQAYTIFGKPQRGDIVVFQSELPLDENTNKLLVKRIIALEGDTISIKDGAVYLNGELLNEPYIKDGYTLGDMDEITVPEGHVFCMGDNRQNSADSRDSRVGCVSVDLLRSKVLFRLFPINSFGSVYKNLQ